MLRVCAQLFNIPLQKAQSAGTAPIPSAMAVFFNHGTAEGDDFIVVTSQPYRNPDSLLKGTVSEHIHPNTFTVFM